MRTCPDLPSGWPVTPKFHPEFGYLFPSARMRRRIRSSLICAALCFGIGAIMVPPQNSVGSEQAQWVRETVEVMTSTVTPSERSATNILGKTVSDILGKTASHATRKPGRCKGSFGSSPVPACTERKTQAKNSKRTTNQVATVMIGHAATRPSPPARQLNPATAATGQAQTVPHVSASLPASDVQKTRPATAETKTSKRAQTRVRHSPRKPDTTAYATAFSHDGNPYHWVAPQPARVWTQF